LSDVYLGSSIQRLQLKRAKYVIRCLWSEGVGISDICRIMTVQYGDDCTRQRNILDWVERVRERGQILLMLRVLDAHRQ